jgi:hypothetical protein
MSDEIRPGNGAPKHVFNGVPRIDAKMKAALVILAVLVFGEVYSLSRMSSMRKAFQSQQASLHNELNISNNQISTKLASIELANDQQLEAVKQELDQASRHMGIQGRELRRARAMVANLQKEHAEQLSEVKHELDLKADQRQLGALTDDVSATKTDLGTTKQNVSKIADDLGMTRTQFGTLIARNHDQIEALRKLGERNYYEFSAVRHQPVHVAGIGVNLQKTNFKHHTFNLAMMVDDLQIEKKNRTVNEPIFFSVQGSRSFCELVVNKVDKGKIAGYISTPKVTSQVASR